MMEARKKFLVFRSAAKKPIYSSVPRRINNATEK